MIQRKIFKKQHLKEEEVKWITDFETENSCSYKTSSTPLEFIEKFFSKKEEKLESCDEYPDSIYSFQINNILKVKCVYLNRIVKNTALLQALFEINNDIKIFDKEDDKKVICDPYMFVEPYYDSESDEELLDFEELEEDIEQIFINERKGLYKNKHVKSLERVSKATVDILRDQKAAEKYSQDILFLKKEAQNFPIIMESEIIKKDVMLIHIIKNNTVKVTNTVHGEFFKEESVCDLLVFRNVFNLTCLLQAFYTYDVLKNMAISLICPVKPFSRGKMYNSTTPSVILVRSYNRIQKKQKRKEKNKKRKKQQKKEKEKKK